MLYQEKYCCPYCFDSKHLKEYVKENKNDTGKCDYCKSQKVPLITVRDMGIHLRECIYKAYESVNNGTGAMWDPEEREYTRPDGAETCVYSIRDIMENNRAISSEAENTSLLEDLFDNIDSDRERQKGSEDPYDDIDDYNWVIRDDLYGVEINSVFISWEEFKHYSLHYIRFMGANRYASGDGFFPKLRNLVLDYEDYISVEDSFFRVRIWNNIVSNIDEIDVYKEIGPPPAEKAKTNRMSPAGIPYLYLSSDEMTAAEECRITRNMVLLGEFKPKRELKIVDLSQSRMCNESNIFDMTYVHENRWLGDVWKGFVNEVSKPIDENAVDHSYEYTPTEMIAEYIRMIGYDGICYKSSVSEGKNFVFFVGPDPEHTPDAYPYPFGDMYLGEHLEILPKFTDYFEIVSVRICEGKVRLV